MVKEVSLSKPQVRNNWNNYHILSLPPSAARDIDTVGEILSVAGSSLSRLLRGGCPVVILILSSHSGHTDTSHTATPLSPYRARGLGQFIANVFLKKFCFKYGENTVKIP